MITGSKFHLVRTNIAGRQYFPQVTTASEGLFDSLDAAKSSVEKKLAETPMHVFWMDRKTHVEGVVSAGSAMVMMQTQYSIFPVDCESDGG